MIILKTAPTVGSFVEGYTVTGVEGKKVFGMKGEVEYTPEPIVPGKFSFRPGSNFAIIDKNAATTSSFALTNAGPRGQVK